MNTKTLSARAMSVIDQYLHFTVGNATCSVPYFNNKTANLRNALRVKIGKGNPKEIQDEVLSLIVKNHIPVELLTSESLKKILVENNIGVDCSALTYYILNAENEDSGKGSLNKRLSFVNRRGFFGKIRAKMRPVENCDVATFADEKNSQLVFLREVQPGDLIIMTGGTSSSTNSVDVTRDHILVVHRVDYHNSVPVVLYYTHTVAYPEDGLYGTGIRQGKIELMIGEKSDGTNFNNNILNAIWSEGQNEQEPVRIFNRVKTSKTTLRRLN